MKLISVNAIKRLPFFGISLGILLLLLSIITDLVFNHLPFSWASIFHLYGLHPLHWIIATSPFFLGAIFYFMRTMVISRENQILVQNEKEKQQVAALENAITKLEVGNLSQEFSLTGNPQISVRLNLLRLNLINEKAEAERREWKAVGLSKLGELLRSYHTIEPLANAMITFLVKYINGNQGSVFIVKDDDPQHLVLNLTACYAYGKKKYLTQSIAPGQGLAGQCYLERETITLYDVPKDYIKITSGLGEATPRSIIIVPIKTTETVEGVLEIASFRRLEKHEIQFTEQVSEAFASVVKSIKVNAQTKILLGATQQQTELHKLQEKEMKQTIEQLQLLYEEATRQLEDTKKLKVNMEVPDHAINKTLLDVNQHMNGGHQLQSSKAFQRA
jgi:hypothetical protein